MATEVEIEEAGFTAAILANPTEDTARKAFADWLDDHFPDRRVQAKYLREIRRHKFVRLVEAEGGWALYPQWAEQRGAKVPHHRLYDTVDVFGHALPRSPRCQYWMRRLGRGWRIPKHIKDLGYYSKAEWFGVSVYEINHVLFRA